MSPAEFVHVVAKTWPGGTIHMLELLDERVTVHRPAA